MDDPVIKGAQGWLPDQLFEDLPVFRFANPDDIRGACPDFPTDLRQYPREVFEFPLQAGTGPAVCPFRGPVIIPCQTVVVGVEEIFKVVKGNRADLIGFFLGPGPETKGAEQ